MKPELARGFYSAATYVSVPFALARLGLKSRQAKGYREHIAERFGFVASPERGVKHIHFHAVSVGETLAAVPVIKSLLEDHPDWSISLSVTTPTGREQAEKHLSDQVYICYLPFDTGSAVRRFLRAVVPDLLVMVETELWPNLIYQCRKQNISTLLLNGRMSEKSARNYLKLASLTRQMMSRIDLVLAQFDEDASRFVTLGCKPDSVLTLGNLKFDAKLSDELRQRAPQQRVDWQMADRPIWIAASTHPGEEESILEVHKRLLDIFPQLLLILVPRHPQRCPEVESLVAGQSLSYQLRSALQESETLLEQSQVLILDTLGELALFYGMTDIAFVGGSLVRHGGHNPIEPALWQLPILTGTHCYNFLEITAQLLRAGALCQCADNEELYLKLVQLLSDPELRQRMGRASQPVIAANQGSLKNQQSQIEQLLASRIEPER